MSPSPYNMLRSVFWSAAASAPLPASVLEALARYDTPTICNAMEIVAPERNIVRATFGGILFVIALYVAVNAALLHVLSRAMRSRVVSGRRTDSSSATVGRLNQMAL